VAALPQFAAKDLAGRTWTLEDLKGKMTFVNFWATWCGPCRAEHPAVQKLFDALAGNAKAQVLTISVDENVAAMRAYLAQTKYTFPVIQSQELADKLMPYVGLPTNLLVNEVCWRTPMYPFGGDAGSLDRVLKECKRAGR
jgi:thiol-disulfide isomerase/thioredoxin